MKKAIVFGLLLLTLFSVAGCETTTTTTTTTALELLDRGTVAVDETIYIEAAPDGTAETMIVVSRIPEAGSGTYLEYGDFSAAQNLSGTDPILIEAGQMAIPVTSDGTDFYYRSTLTEGYKPPFLLSFVYTKDGIPVNPIEAKGEPGIYVMEITMTANPEAEDGFRNQFMGQLQVTLPASRTEVTETTGGTLVLAGGSYTIGYQALPGSTATYFLTMETAAFAISSIQATFTRFDPAILGENLSGIGTELQTLKDGLTALRDGQTALKTGLETLSSALSELSAGSSEAAAGIDQLSEGLTQMADSAELLAANLGAIADGAAQLKTAGSDLLAGYNGLMVAVTDVYSTFSALHGDDAELMTKLMTLAQTAEAINDAIEAYVNGVNGCADGLVPLSEGMDTLAGALRTAEASLTTLADGESILAVGLAELSTVLADLPASIQTMIDAQTVIIDGINESTDELEFLFADPLPLVSFTSSDNPAPLSVQFIYSVRGF